MLRFIKGFFPKPKSPDTLAPVAPYKIEAPVTDWPFPKPTETVPPAPVVASVPVKKTRAPAKPKAAPVMKPAVAAKKPRAQKIPTK